MILFMIILLGFFLIIFSLICNNYCYILEHNPTARFINDIRRGRKYKLFKIDL